MAQHLAEKHTNLFSRPREQCKAISLKSGVVFSKDYEDQTEATKEKLKEKKQGKEAPVPNKIPMKNEVVEAYKPRIPYPQWLQEVAKEQSKSLPKEEMQNHIKEREKNSQGSPHSNESDKCLKVDLIESSI
ncbi:hypothetical protein AHAS_Ahas01G0153000 [Arachis hypogaea]